MADRGRDAHGTLGFFALIALTCGTVIVLGIGFLAVSAFNGSGPSVNNDPADGSSNHGKDASDVTAAAQTMALDDHADDPTPYIDALTTLNQRCRQSALDIDTVDVLTAQTLMNDVGDHETKLAILQAMVKVTDVSPDVKGQDCESVAKALTAGVQSQSSAAP